MRWKNLGRGCRTTDAVFVVRVTGPPGAPPWKIPGMKGIASTNMTTSIQLSVDGMLQGPGGPEEDTLGLFQRGGWAHFDEDAAR